jgi:hypothetical protein
MHIYMYVCTHIHYNMWKFRKNRSKFHSKFQRTLHKIIDACICTQSIAYIHRAYIRLSFWTVFLPLLFSLTQRMYWRVCMYAHVLACMHTCIHACTNPLSHAHTHTRTHPRARTHTHTHTYTRNSDNKQASSRLFIIALSTYIHTYIHTSYIHTHIHKYTNSHAHAHTQFWHQACCVLLFLLSPWPRLHSRLHVTILVAQSDKPLRQPVISQKHSPRILA